MRRVKAAVLAGMEGVFQSTPERHWVHDLLVFTRHWIHYGALVFVIVLAVLAAAEGLLAAR